jgi:hypothetical protein
MRRRKGKVIRMRSLFIKAGYSKIAIEMLKAERGRLKA